MANLVYGNNEQDEALRDVVDMFRSDQIGKVEGQGFISSKAVHSFVGGTSVASGILIPFGIDTSIWGGFVRVEGIGAAAGSLDFDLGLTAGTDDFGAGYGLNGDGVYALKANDFVDIGTPEDLHLSIDVNTYASTVKIKVTIMVLSSVTPATS
mgnify:FL=1